MRTLKEFVRLDGKIIFNDQYGPYDAVCVGNCAVIHTDDSLETFTMYATNATPFAPPPAR